MPKDETNTQKKVSIEEQKVYKHNKSVSENFYHKHNQYSYKPSSEFDHIEHIRKNSRIGSICLLYTSPSPRDKRQSRMPSSA